MSSDLISLSLGLLRPQSFAGPNAVFRSSVYVFPCLATSDVASAPRSLASCVSEIPDSRRFVVPIADVILVRSGFDSWVRTLFLGDLRTPSRRLVSVDVEIKDHCGK